MSSRHDIVARFRGLQIRGHQTHAYLHFAALLIFLVNLLCVPIPWRDFGFVLASLLGIGAGITQVFWEYRHDASTLMGKAIEWIVLGYMAMGAWGIGELYAIWAATYHGLS
jgi:hypothetical protein